MKNKGLLLIFMLISFWATAQSNEAQNPPSQKEVVFLKQKIKVFPNPATNVVNILGLRNSNQASITITDISGNVLLQHEWEIRNNSVSIPIPNLDAGIYVARINSDEQQIQTKFYKN